MFINEYLTEKNNLFQEKYFNYDLSYPSATLFTPFNSNN